MDPSQLGGYEIKRVLGEGGMGKVYLAHDPTLDRPVAIKVIRAQALSSEGKSRFFREARACSRISHPNIITVYSAGEDGATPFLAMEFLEGRTLREVIADGPVDWRTAIRWTAALLDALSRLHAEGIVHRDLKPENIMIIEDTTPKLMDFGLAHLQSSTVLTQDGTTLGTVPYMAPEQVLGKAADARSDLFSIATILHEMLTGLHPFRGEHPMAVMYSIQHDTPRPIKLHSQDYPPGLQDVMDRGFQKETDKRFADAAAFRDALAALLPEVSGTIAASGFPRGSRAMMLGLVAVAVVTMALLVWQGFNGRRSQEQARNANETGQVHLDQKNYDAAELEFRRAIKINPRYAIAWHNLGMTALAKRDTVECDVSLARAAELDARYPAPRFLRGVLSENRGDAAAAESFYRDAIRAQPNFYAAYSNLIALYIDAGRWEEARAALATALAAPRDVTIEGWDRLLQKQELLDSRAP